MIKLSEHSIQTQIVQYLKWSNIECFAIPNGIFFNSASKNQTYAYINKLRKEGFREGCSDLVVLLKNRVIFIEIKSTTGKQSDKQKEFETKVKELGFEYYVWRDIDAAEEFVKGLK